MPLQLTIKQLRDELYDHLSLTQNEHGLKEFIRANKANILSHYHKLEFKLKNQAGTVPLLIAAIMRDFSECTKILLSWGISPDATLKSRFKSRNNLSALAIACQRDNKQIVRSLLASAKEPIIISSQPLLFSIQSDLIWTLILNRAKKEKVLKALLNQKRKETTAFCHACQSYNSVAIDRFISTPGLVEEYGVIETISDLRTGFYLNLDNDFFESRINDLKKKFNQTFPMANTFTQPRTTQEACDDLFTSTTIPPGMPESKEMALKKAIVKIHELLSWPPACFIYLGKLNDLLKEYFIFKHKTAFPELSTDEYNFERIQDLSYPIPNDNYKGIKKYSALQELLILLLQRHDMAQKAVKAVGFLPPHIINRRLKEGALFLETSYLNTLLHTKFGHMLQWAIIVLAIEAGKILLDYQTHGKIRQIKTLEILASIATPNRFSDNKGKTVWTTLFDTTYSDKTYLTDPYRVSTLIMHEIARFPILGRSLIDSFCKGFKRAKDAHQIFLNRTISNEEFIMILQDTKRNIIIGSEPFVTIYQNYYSRQLHQRDGDYVEHSSSRDVMINCAYQPDTEFKIPPAKRQRIK